MIDIITQMKSLLWRASVLASLLFLLYSLIAATAHAETDSSRVARLFMWASDGNVRHRDLVDPAKDSLGQMGAKAAPWLAKKLGTSDARERLTLADIFEKIGKPATPVLIPFLEAPGEDTPRNTARCLERIKDTAAVIPLLAQMDHPEYSVRSQVATALGKIRDSQALDSLINHLEYDPDSDVRKSCAVAIGDCGDGDGVKSLVGALSDKSFAVRQSSMTALIKLKAPSPLLDLATIEAQNKVDATARYSRIVALSGISEPRAEKVIDGFLLDSDPMVRGFAVEGLGAGAALLHAARVANLKQRETDPFVLAQIARFEQIVIEKKNAEAKPK
jgi:HEAT repeat protein